MSNSWVYVRYVNTFTILVLHWVLLSCRSSLTKAALYYLITGLVLALRQKNRKTAKSSFETWKNDVDWELTAAKHHFHYWDCLNSTAPNYREDLSKKRLVMSHSVETHCKLTDFLCKRDGESWSWVQCTPAWTFTMFEWLGEIPGGTIAVDWGGRAFSLSLFGIQDLKYQYFRET